MKAIGQWMESLADDDLFPPQEFTGDWPVELRRHIADYLDGGVEFEAYRCMAYCYLCDFQQPDRELSDGTWIWPEILGHYVRAHGIALPWQFLRLALAGARPIPRREWKEQGIDGSFWTAWCRSRVSSDYRSRLEAARTTADEQARRSYAEWLAKEVAIREAAEGIADERCSWLGCQNRALRGRALCAACLLKPHGSPPISHAQGCLPELFKLWYPMERRIPQ
jgi:hypothetical protein